MDYIEINCRVNPPDPWRDILIAQLGESGCESFEETENGMKAYIPAEDFDQQSIEQALKINTEEQVPDIDFDITLIKAQNWNQLWESNFEPVRIENRCYIRAPFHQADPGIEMEIIIEPKMSFGTGHHQTNLPYGTMAS
jgi:ribosomal protein L11 methyltransferase